MAGEPDIRDKPPVEYVAAIKPRFSHTAWAQMCELHALPEDWQEMDYADFWSNAVISWPTLSAAASRA